MISKKIVVLFVLISTISIYSQNQNQIGIHVGTNKIHSMGFGGEVYANRQIFNALHLNISIGYYEFDGKEIVKDFLRFSDEGNIIKSDADVTLSFGLKYFFSDKVFKPYFGVSWELDYLLKNDEYLFTKIGEENSFSDIYEKKLVSEGDSIFENGLGWDFGVQYQLQPNLSLDVSVGLRYLDSVSNAIRILGGLAYSI